MSARGSHARPRSGRLGRWPYGLPSIILVVSWIGIWTLWPHPAPKNQHTRVPAATRLRFIDPQASRSLPHVDWRAFMCRPDTTQPPAADASPAEAARPVEPHPRFLARAMGPSPSGAQVEIPMPDLPREAEARMHGYRPIWPVLDPFGKPPVFHLQYVVDVGPELANCGFAVADPVFGGVDGGDQPWDLTLYVACGEDGRARDVFALSDSGLSNAQSNIVRLLYDAKGIAGKPCEGRLTVRWARVPDTTRHLPLGGKDST